MNDPRQFSQSSVDIFNTSFSSVCDFKKYLKDLASQPTSTAINSTSAEKCSTLSLNLGDDALIDNNETEHDNANITLDQELSATKNNDAHTKNLFTGQQLTGEVDKTSFENSTNRKNVSNHHQTMMSVHNNSILSKHDQSFSNQCQDNVVKTSSNISNIPNDLSHNKTMMPLVNNSMLSEHEYSFSKNRHDKINKTSFDNPSNPQNAPRHHQTVIQSVDNTLLLKHDKSFSKSNDPGKIQVDKSQMKIRRDINTQNTPIYDRYYDPNIRKVQSNDFNKQSCIPNTNGKMKSDGNTNYNISALQASQVPLNFKSHGSNTQFVQNGYDFPMTQNHSDVKQNHISNDYGKQILSQSFTDKSRPVNGEQHYVAYDINSGYLDQKAIQPTYSRTNEETSKVGQTQNSYSSHSLVNRASTPCEPRSYTQSPSLSYRDNNDGTCLYNNETTLNARFDKELMTEVPPKTVTNSMGNNNAAIDPSFISDDKKPSPRFIYQVVLPRIASFNQINDNMTLKSPLANLVFKALKRQRKAEKDLQVGQTYDVGKLLSKAGRLSYQNPAVPDVNLNVIKKVPLHHTSNPFYNDRKQQNLTKSNNHSFTQEQNLLQVCLTQQGKIYLITDKYLFVFQVFGV